MDKLGGILPGMDWQKALENGVDASFALIALLSRNYLSSNWCEREYKRADMKKIPIIPACVGDLSGVNMPMALQTVQYADLSRETAYDAEFAKLLAGIKNQTGVAPGTPKPLPPLNPNPYRDDPEDKMANSEQEITKSVKLSAVDELKMLEIEELAKDVALVRKQYLAVRTQYRLEINPAMLVKLEENIDHYYNEYKKLLERLESLHKG